MRSAGVELSFRDQPHRADESALHVWEGFSLERVRIGSRRAFEYDWQGPTNFLALHDIRLDDGEINVAGKTVTGRSDLRNSLTFIPHGTRVSGWSQLSADRHGYTALFFDPSLAEAEFQRPLLGARLRPLVYFEDRNLARTLLQLERLATDDASERLAAETLGLLAILQLYPSFATGIEPGTGRLSMTQQKALEDLIQSGMATAISLSDMAAAVGLSRFHFARSFTRTFGRTPHQYVLARRVGLAASLLSATDLPVSEIAPRTGFSSPARLSTAFRRIFGTSPKRFRQLVR